VAQGGGAVRVGVRRRNDTGRRGGGTGTGWVSGAAVREGGAAAHVGVGRSGGEVQILAA
jgi:hypothetical protein